MSGKGSILIIDDEQEIRESLEQLLRLEGYQADSAATADEGMRRVESGSANASIRCSRLKPTR